MNWWSELVCETYPPVEIFESKRNITISELRRFVRIVLTEGIPCAFAQFPLAYEFARQRAAERIGVDPKQISITGSARLGYSLSPHKFGKAYDPSASDVDLFLIDETRFAALAQEFADFVALFESAKIHPRNERERANWEENKRIVPSAIRRGFIDQKYVPAWNQFPMAQRLGDAKFKFQDNLNSAIKNDTVKKVSLRVYRDWDAAVAQISYTLMTTLEKRAAAVGS